MLTRPEYGWTEFQLPGTAAYGLSYLTNIPRDWLEAAIRGLETGSPFCVEGFLEPGEFRCTVGLESSRVEPENAEPETAPVGMVRFCRMLLEDIRCELSDWAAFGRFGDPAQRERELIFLLQRLDALLRKKEKTRLFYQFSTQQERREMGGSDFVELAFCIESGTEGDLLEIERLPIWKDDSLYVRDEHEFFKAYENILGHGVYCNGQEGIVDPYGVSFYSPSRLEEIIARVREQRPEGWETLLPWLERARSFNGFYILGV